MGTAQGRVIVFAGGGTGGHLFPGLAIAHEVRRLDPAARCVFACSTKPLDAEILTREGAEFKAIAAKPFGVHPLRLAKFVLGWGPAVRASRSIVRGASAVVAMGGYVAAPVVQAARAERIPVTLINLDAVPGKANRWIARHANRRMSAIRIAEHARFARECETIRPIVRPAAVASGTPAECRSRLGLEPDRPTLLVTGGSQGSASVNNLVLELVKVRRGILSNWQVLHQCGKPEEERVREGYKAAGVHAKVCAFIPTMGDAWGSADLAISRCGAGSVAEAWANAVPTVFMPYPYHRDEHQRWNAQPLVDAGGGVIFKDQIDAKANLEEMGPQLGGLIDDGAVRGRMRAALKRLGPADGATSAAKAILGLPA